MSPHRTFCGFDGKDDPVNWKLALCTHIQQIVARSGHTKENQLTVYTITEMASLAQRKDVKQKIVNVSASGHCLHKNILFARSGHSNWNLRFPLVYPLLALLN